ncbi:hypothetical protein [Cellulomonas sp. KRMCY2]|uniref:hypothetical protein n=1 Tax=Cellulomonas sp. KRMCY2 TaxID=1304865 RepID=UPI00045E5EA1|nr:hypothetical protein [Cellulomonas sp. KRMCY2]
MPRIVVPVLLVLVGALTGCAADAPTSAEGDTDTAVVSSECGPSTDPAVLTAVTLTDDADGLAIAWATAGTASRETVLWSVVVQDAAYEAAYQIGVKVTGGATTAFVFDQLDYTQENLTASPEITDGGAAVVVPWEALPGLETGTIEWRGALNVDGTDVAVCPLPGDDLLDPAKAALDRE